MVKSTNKGRNMSKALQQLGVAPARGRPPKKSKDLMTYRVAIKLTREVYEKIKATSEKGGISMSDYLRKLVSTSL